MMKRLLGILACCASLAGTVGEAQTPYDLLIRGGTVIDGTGADGYAADVAVSGDRVVAVSRTPLDPRSAERVIDASGKVVAPGFIDMHAHLDPLLRLPDAESHVRQGVTTALGGPDGGSAVPLGPYLDSAKALGVGMNVAFLVGHNDIRETVMGMDARAPTTQELEEMQAMVARAMREGAWGLSTGLKYLPGAYSETDEVVALASTAARSGGIYTSHLREEGLGLIESVAEGIEIGRRAGIPVVLTHHKVVGAPMWGSSVRTLAMVDSARSAGIDVMIDQYPYTATYTGISVLVPAWARANGDSAFFRRLEDPALRDSIMDGIVFNILNDRGGGDIRRVQFAKVRWMPELEGKTLRDWALMQDLEPTPETGAALVVEAMRRGGASAIYHVLDEADVERIMQHPQTMIGSDGRLTQPGEGHPHPRWYGTFPRVLGHYVRDEGVLTLQEALHKMTGMPAARLGLAGRGRVATGAFADLVVFDPETVADKATFQEPHQYPVGIDYVIVNGVLAVDAGEFMGQRAGRVLRKNMVSAAAAPHAGPAPLAGGVPANGELLVLQEGARSPAYASDGRLALELRGDIWISRADPAATPANAPGLVQVTSGSAWDADPAWAEDGNAIIFTSDRSGGPDLWRIQLANGQAGEPQPLVATTAPESDAAVAATGDIVFVRGTGAGADLWLREIDGSERPLTEDFGADLAPTFSPDGLSVAFTAERAGRTSLRVVRLGDGESETIVNDREAEFPTWSPDGSRIAFTTRAGAAGVWLTSKNGSYVNQVSHLRAQPAWAPGGDHLLLAELPRQDAGYNGDPNRFGERHPGGVFPANGALWLLRPGAVPDEKIIRIPVQGIVSASHYNLSVLNRIADRVSQGLARRSPPGAVDEWNALLAEHHDAVRTAASEAELESAIYDLMSERPTYLPEVTGRAAVSSAHPLATEAGLEILQLGGNVVDAAVAVSFALGVVEPDASGIGGYGSMVLYLQGMDEPTAIEFLTRLPEAASLSNGYLISNGGDIPDSGPVVANVPGTVGGMWLAWEKYGSGELEWAELLAPAIRLAEEGFVLDNAFPTTLQTEREGFAKYESSRQLFFRDGEPLQAGDTFRNPDLAWTLRQVAEGGADAFYSGEIAERMVADLHGQGNAMRLSDLDRYYAVEREPITGSYRGNAVYSSPLATSGGAVLMAKLNLLEQFDDPKIYSEDSETLHAMIEAWKLMPSTSGHIADPGLWPVNLEPFISKDTAVARWSCFDPSQSSQPAAPDSLPCEGLDELTASWGDGNLLDCEGHTPATGGSGCRRTGTTAFAIADSNGNMISVTQTLGTWGGNFYVTPGLGFLYNDKLGSYSDNPESFNARIPFARNVTTISPTLVFEGTGEDKEPLLAVGAAGNSWITAAVYQVIAGVVDGDLSPQEALELPRFLPAGDRLPDGSRGVVIQMESGYSPEVVQAMRALGHRLQIISRVGELRMGYGAAVMVTDEGVRAGADPRRSGAAGAIHTPAL